MPIDITNADRKSTNNEDYDVYEGSESLGEIKDNPSVHIYIAHQIMDTVTEGTQYEEPDNSSSTDDASQTPEDATENSETT